MPAPLGDAAGTIGPAMLPLTPWHHLLLLGYANPFFCGGVRTPAAALQYLWICSPRFRPSAWRFRFFAWRWRARLSRPAVWPRVLAAIDAHTALILMDRPPHPRAPRAAAVPLTPRDGPHELASLELICRRHLRYTRAEYWHTPYGHTNQLLALHYRAQDPEAPDFDATRDHAKGDYLRAKKRRRLAPPA
jgi:hypothetical protein